MNFRFSAEDTIVAPATAPGVGAIGIVRLSGTQAIAIAERIFYGKPLSKQPTHTLRWGKIQEKERIIDEVVAAVFRAPGSYTGEDTVEFYCHGSPYILAEVVDLCIREGARQAMPGEFTQRAFIQGKLDLTQAEAVADLIASANKASHEIAIMQMRGGISSELSQLREQLIHFTALIELELDFSDEDVAFANRKELEELIAAIENKVVDLIQSFTYGNAIKNGVPVAIIGKPNAGKSTLLNALLQEERAIVSDIAGTTRDSIEETMTIEGITFRFIDTAGIRETDDVIEAIGVQRAKEKVKQSQVVIHLYEDDTRLLDQLAEDLSGKLVFNLASKADLSGRNVIEEAALLQQYPAYKHFSISVKTSYHIDKLKSELVAYFQEQRSGHDVIVSHLRHKEALEKTLAALQQVSEGLANSLPGDLLSLHLKDALYYLGSITGKIDVDQDILGAIFGKFCIGK